MDTTVPTSITLAELPRIGQLVAGGIFAGITTDGEKAFALVLLPGDEDLSWKDANEWAEKQGGVLPSRIDQLVLFKNLRTEFQREWYWSAEPCAGDESSAWCQTFGSGDQINGPKGTELRARAVRRLAI